MAKTIKVGIFGAGNFANNQHLPNLSRVDDVEIVAICDVNEQAARDTAGRFDIPHVYTDGHEMLDKEPMDAMWSIVPAFARTDVEATAASKGIHLFSEKPQALEMSVARRIDEAVRKAGVLSAVCFRERYRPIFQEARGDSKGRRSPTSVSKASATFRTSAPRARGTACSRRAPQPSSIGDPTQWTMLGSRAG